MKHVFVIGSHTPYLSALSIIELRHIDAKDIIFIIGRKYKCCQKIDGAETYDMSDIYYIYLRNNSKKKITATIDELDRFIEGKIGENYILYLPHLSFFFFQGLATHRLCADIKFMQEGIADFCIDETKKKRRSFRQWYVDTFYMVKGRTWQASGWNDYRYNVHRCSETFAVSEGLFKKMDCKHTIIKWPQMSISCKLEPDASCFVFESLVEQKNIEKDVFMDATSKLIRKYGRNMNYVKFHPYQTKEHQQQILDIFKSLNLAVEELPADVPFEMILASEPHLTVCGFTTSLIFYAALMPQHEAHICVPALYKSKKFIANYWNNYNGHIMDCYGHSVFKYETLESVIGGGDIISCKYDMHEWIKADFESYRMVHPVAARFTYGENWELFSYMRNLRHLEYYTNKPRKMPWDKLLRGYYWLRHRRNTKLLNITISPNSVGPGFHLQHRGYRLFLGDTRIGMNCEVLPMVLIGKKSPEIKECPISIGDNCYISTGVTILGPITIGNNVTIAAGAVVTKDIPDNCIVAGIPAKIIKFK